MHKPHFFLLSLTLSLLVFNGCVSCPEDFELLDGQDGVACYEAPPEAVAGPSGENPYGAGAHDLDGDGHAEDVDCDETDPTIHPAAVDVPYDGIDQDCVDGDLVDVDGDGHDGLPAGGDDCDDGDETVHPSAEETPYDGVDQDCDDEDLVDVDGDGWWGEEAGGPDCDDEAPDVNPGMEEDCDGFLDLDCDGEAGGDDLECQLIFPEDGSWSGTGIDFTVSGGGTVVTVTYAAYGSCSVGGCSSSGSASCGGGCATGIDVEIDGTTFHSGAMGCSGTFTSPTTATGSCSDWSSGCGCTMSRSWSASI